MMDFPESLVLHHVCPSPLLSEGPAPVCVSKTARWTSACELKCLIETAQALEAGIGRYIDDGIVRGDKKPLSMRNAVPGQEIGDGGAECLAEERHCIVWVEPNGAGNLVGGHRLVVMPRDVTR